MTSTMGYIWNTLYGWTDTGSGGLLPPSTDSLTQPIGHHVAHPDTKRRMHELISASGLIDSLKQIDAAPAAEADILRVHDQSHYDRILAESALPKGGDAGDGVSPFGHGGHRIAMLAAGGAIEAVRTVVEGQVSNAYALINPPGHHAERSTGRGFCTFNNGAVAAAYARDVLGLKRVAIVDWDVHHGNGAQDIFGGTAEVLNISVHQDRCFPSDSGFREERGHGEGFGYTLNVPLPPGGGSGAYEYAFDTVVLPAVRAYKPDLIIVASGFDASIMDPLARMMMRSEGFRSLVRKLVDLAAEVSQGRLVCLQEGGYSPIYVPFCGLAVIEEMAGVSTGTQDAYTPILGAMGGDKLLEHEREAIDLASVLVSDIH
ncbi:class II histone deacetylase [Nesterenkonia aurantiaca]|uniref:Acetoin utilization deacetylase AcuC-like enzyme n=1 Tax=Nesterenkonia aurantiaca TaxID=1436010 RepID=A0A4R7FZC9_9MICC|nr:class II histone deacetylase [Nesterenkonia aurantiaca]TDS84249.1 acetoin utilization deacetylase AcuC-like enzyme [Nesterenkonia aurantiaca]